PIFYFKIHLLSGVSRGRPIVRLTVFVTDMLRYRPLVNEVQQERWANKPLPPRTIVEVSALNQHDFVEVEAILARINHPE
ncbi:RidA family protein, partial [Erwinia endophytica]|uniref:RidA family protein n=1 Tax=Erwinia endophytica TaxID=1563158 RepID=UPI00186B598C